MRGGGGWKRERETGFKKKKKTSGSLDREGRKTKGRRDTTPREGCVCLCVCLHVRAIERPSFCSEKGGFQGGPGASSHLGSPLTPVGPDRPRLAVAVAGCGPTPAANALRSCQLGPFWPPPLAGPPQSSCSRSQEGLPFWVRCREVSLT